MDGKNIGEVVQGIWQLFFFAGVSTSLASIYKLSVTPKIESLFWITHPASASNFITFMLSDFNKKLQTPGFLASGLVLFGDNAYLSNATMATPYKGVKEGVKDDYNYFHFQLQIQIEIMFEMHTRCWGIHQQADVNKNVYK